MEALSEQQLFALELRDMAITRVTTPVGRGLLYLCAAPSFINRGRYLPAPVTKRFLQSSPKDPDTRANWFTVSRGIDHSMSGMTTIGQHSEYFGPPDTVITYDIKSALETDVRFYRIAKDYRSHYLSGPSICMGGRAIPYERIADDSVGAISCLNSLALAVGFEVKRPVTI